MEMNTSTTGKLKLETRSMNSLRTLISGSADPVFLLNPDDQTIVAANDTAISACGDVDLVGKKLDQVVHFETLSDQPNDEIAYFNNQWLVPHSRRIKLNHKTYNKLDLAPSSSIPDDNTLFTIRKMIAVLLHRLRSPMTGMQGYLEMIQDVKHDNDKRKLAKVGEGLDYLFEIMDELELLHHAEAYLEDEPNATASDAETVIRQMLIEYPVELRNRVKIETHTNQQFEFNSAELKQIVTLLLNNSAEHQSGINKPVKIDIHSGRKITVTNFGTPIPDEVVDNLYFPFVTTKANNLGIGLSLAQLIAGRRGATIVLTENSPVLGISFSLICKPQEISS
ncbi:HAMP domain-containing sensor histidine kinase [Rhodohalobacter sp. SW132]|uniref:sensor histidine kinase n=2 Tax=Rhodohalobacter sp. SW132 TaxID=2293433 RepID=UPI001AE04EF4|nr:HAMP domain-containing sensor histidine kinase [Rhodohalobacter sp. SW132]